MKKSFYLMGKGTKIISVAMAAVVTVLTVLLLLNRNGGPWPGKAFCVVIDLSLIVFCVMFFTSRVTVDSEKRQVKIVNVRSKKLSFDEIEAVTLDLGEAGGKQKGCFIAFTLTDGRLVKVAGYNSLSSKNSIECTREIVDGINELLV